MGLPIVLHKPGWEKQFIPHPQPVYLSKSASIISNFYVINVGYGKYIL